MNDPSKNFLKIDRSKFVDESEEDIEEFTCRICYGIFDDPVVTQCCQQTYCRQCIRKWLSEHKSCPNDKKDLTSDGLRPAPIALINLLENLKIKCNYEEKGCPAVVALGNLSQHVTNCKFRSTKLCSNCGLIKDIGVSTHDCIGSLVRQIHEIQGKYDKLLDEKLANDVIISMQDKQMTKINDDFKIKLAQIESDLGAEVVKLKKINKAEIKQLKTEISDLSKVKTELEHRIETIVKDQAQILKDCEERHQKAMFELETIHQKNMEEIIDGHLKEIGQLMSVSEHFSKLINDDQLRALKMKSDLNDYNERRLQQIESCGKQEEQGQNIGLTQEEWDDWLSRPKRGVHNEL